MSQNNNKDNKNKNKNKNKKPVGPKVIAKSKYFKIGIRDSARVRIIKEGMNHLFDTRNQELEEAFLQEATQYTERVLGESRRFRFNEEEDREAMDVIFNNSGQEESGAMAELTVEEVLDGVEEEQLEEAEEAIDGEEEERLEREADGEDDTLDSEGVIELNERIQAEDQEEYERIRAELEEDEANKDN